MRLRHVEILHAIKQTGSLSAAAKSLAITQPAASKVLKHAEQQLGFPLFHRTRGRLQLTDQADLLMEEVTRVFEALERTRRVAQTLRSGLDTHLRIVCLPSLGMDLVPRTVQLFKARRPGTTIEIATRHDPEMQGGLVARDFDIGIGFGPPDGAATLPGLSATMVDTGELVYIDHPCGPGAAGQGPIPLSRIDHRRMIGLTSAHFLGAAMQAAFRREAIEATPGIQVQTYYIARTLVAAGTGCAIVDEFTAHAAARDIVVRPLEPALRFGVYAYAREQHPPSRRAREFVSCLRTVCQEMQRPRPPAPIAAPAFGEGHGLPQTAATAATKRSTWSARKPARLMRPSATR